MILFFNPVFKEKIWGGNRLKSLFGFDIPSEKTGECWGISAHPHGQTTVKDGLFAGWTLARLWAEKRALFGNLAGDAFPILVKIIDAHDDLSIQVHPDDAQAKSLGSFGKTECWYVLHADHDAKMVIGHQAKDSAEFRRFVEHNQFEALVNAFPIKAGDYFFIEPGTLHAIGAGTVLLEVQQSSDITYRFYDYGRLENGVLRPLHLKEALAVVTIPDAVVKQTHDDRFFSFEVAHKTNYAAVAHTHGDFIIILEGEGKIDDAVLKKGDFLFVSSKSPYHLSGTLTYAKVSIT